MKYRTALLLPSEDVGASGTKVIDIDVDKPISRIEFTFKTTKALDAMTAPGPANITKIELVDGSKVLHSLNGYENQALAYFSRPGNSMEHGQHQITLSEVDLYALDFGRHLWDTLLAFDAKRFTNPQLRISFDEDLADTSVTANALEVWAHIFDELAVSPMGFLSAIEHYSYTCGSDNSYELIELPEDKVIRQLLVRAYQDGYEPWYQIDEARLDEGTLGRIPWEYTDLEMYYRRMKSHWPIIVTPFECQLATSARTFYIPQTDFYAHVALTSLGGANYGGINGASARGGKASLIGASGGLFVGSAKGYLPWHCFQFPMGRQDDIEDWYNPEGKKPRLRLRASTGGTSGTGQVVLEELHKY
jgi:hypothetical protein